MSEDGAAVVARQRERRAENLGALAAHAELGTLALRCECGRADCAETIDVPVDEFRHLSENGPGRRVVMRAHCIPGQDRVVRREEHYDVLRTLVP